MTKFIATIATTFVMGFALAYSVQGPASAALPPSLELPQNVAKTSDTQVARIFKKRKRRDGFSNSSQFRLGNRDRNRARYSQRHIDWCLRQNMGYNVRNNTLDFNINFKEQCISPYINDLR